MQKGEFAMTPIQKTLNAVHDLDDMMNNIVKIKTLQGSMMDEKCRDAYVALYEAQEKVKAVHQQMERQLTW